MAWWIVSDVVGRLSGYLSYWRQVDHMALYFGGRNNLNKVDKALRKVQAWLVGAERRLIENHGDAPGPVKKLMKSLKSVLYEMEELFEEMNIAELERGLKSAAVWNCNLIRILYNLPNLPGQVKTVQRAAKQVDAVMKDLKVLISDMQKDQDYSIEEHDRDNLPNRIDIDDFMSSREGCYYKQLTPYLKQCISYCSLFPEEYIFDVQKLINLWVAQGFLEPAVNANYQSQQEEGYRFFMELLSEGFFKLWEVSDMGVVTKSKMDLIFYHVAVAMGRAECLLVDEHADLVNINDNIHHVSFIVGSSWQPPQWLLAAKQLRSLLLIPKESVGFLATIYRRKGISSVTIQNLDELLSSLTCLRALELGRIDLHNLPDSIGGLKHLRYVKLGGFLRSLPQSMTKLHYLQILDTKECHQLNQFTVDESNSLDSLVRPNHITPRMEIFFKRCRRGAITEARAADLKNKLINDLIFEWSSSYQVADAHADHEKEESVLRMMKPPHSLKSLEVRFWKGTRFPAWETSAYVNLPNLVSIEIEGCDRCIYLPSLSRLPFLRNLRLANLKALQFIEQIGGGTIDNEAASSAYFPSLKNLKLEEMPELKGWSSGIWHQVFPQLCELRIHNCPRLMSMPLGPSLQSLKVEEIHEKLLKQLQKSPATLSTLTTTPENLVDVQIASIPELKYLSFHPYCSIQIKMCKELVDLKVLSTSNLDSSVRLDVYNCGRLRDISGGLQHIEELKIWRCEELRLWDTMEDDDGGDYVGRNISISTNVRSLAWEGLTRIISLTLGSLTKLESLPRGLAGLPTLKYLKIYQLCNLRALPEWIGCITNLTQLEIIGCPNMRSLFDSSVGELDTFRISSPLLTLKIERCQGLTNLFGGISISFNRLVLYHCDRLKDISAEELEIEELEVYHCLNLHLWEDSGKGSASSGTVSVSLTAWQHLKRLRSFTIGNNLKLEYLPRGLTCLTALQKLKIFRLHNLRQLPEWIGHISQLKDLYISACPKVTALPGSLRELTTLNVLSIRQCNPELRSRCQRTTGEDWPKIQHIFDIDLR